MSISHERCSVWTFKRALRFDLRRQQPPWSTGAYGSLPFSTAPHRLGIYVYQYGPHSICSGIISRFERRDTYQWVLDITTESYQSEISALEYPHLTILPGKAGYIRFTSVAHSHSWPSQILSQSRIMFRQSPQLQFGHGDLQRPRLR